jgi:UDP-glucose 4-epimerase
MRTVLTGSAGRIGRAIAARLRADGGQVCGVDRLASDTTDVVADIADAAIMQSLLAGADAVVHTASLHAPHVGLLSDAEFDRVNVLATAQLIRLCVAEKISKIVYTSTTALYGAASQLPDRAAWITEQTAPQPSTIYHRSKLAAEALLRNAAADYGWSVSVLRMSRCFPEPIPQMAVYRLHRGVDARDVAAAHRLALADQRPGFWCYNISAATPFLVSDLIELKADASSVIARRAPALAAAFAERGWPLPSAIDRVYCAELAMRELGYRPAFGFEELLAD